ncbi:PhzF family phenazine biosynthesis protein [Shouchella sp. 1P09AA]|uniref:PhzF family phenazine biosynthesis protein n=1 Tax=unclassified Shouchella TaxID=2893065 RepID=UPI0039A0F786
MVQLPFYIVDVFAERAYSGNQLAVFIVEENLSPTVRQKIAKELHFSESIFIKKRKDSLIDVWIHTPEEEIPFAGHPLIGAAYVWSRHHQSTGNHLTFYTKAGLIPISYEEKRMIYWMQQQSPDYREVILASEAAKVLGLDVKKFDPSWPVQEISTGLPVIVAPVKTMEAVKHVKLNLSAYQELIDRVEAKGICVFAMEGDRSDIYVRDFAPFYGIQEDAATGSSNGAILAAIMRKENGEGVSLLSEQGVEMGRPSLLYLRGEKSKVETKIFVGGNVVQLAKGLWDVEKETE